MNCEYLVPFATTFAVLVGIMMTIYLTYLTVVKKHEKGARRTVVIATLVIGTASFCVELHVNIFGVSVYTFVYMMVMEILSFAIANLILHHILTQHRNGWIQRIPMSGP